MTTKKTSKKAPQQPTKQSHYYDVTMAIEIAANQFFAQLGYGAMPEYMKTAMIAGIIIPPEIKDESPCLYFDFSRMALPDVDKALMQLRCALDIKAIVNPDVLTVYDFIKSKFPPVKLA